MTKHNIDISHVKENKYLAQIIAALLSDGSVERGLLIKFTNKDSNLIKEFIKVFRNVMKIPHEKIKGNFKSKKDNEVKITYICSVDIIRFLKKYSNTYRTKPFRDKNKEIIRYPPAKIHKFILKGSKEIKKYFLRMYVSCDGCVEVNIRYITKEGRYDVRGCVSFICQHPIILKQLYTLLKSLEFNPIKKEGSIRIGRIKEIKTFKQIGFIKNCKITSTNRRVYFFNRSKNDVLDLLIYTLKYGMPRDLLFCKKTIENKQRIIDYISNILTEIENKKKLSKVQYKEKRNYLTKEEKNWLLLRREMSVSQNLKCKLLSQLYLKRYNKPILSQTIHYIWKKKNEK